MSEIVEEAPKKKRGRPRKIVVEIPKVEPIILPKCEFIANPSNTTIKISNIENNPYGTAVSIYSAPTNNCQLLCIASFASVITTVKKKDQFQHVLKCISRRVNKRLILVDIQSSYISQLKQVLDPNQITLEQNYTSSNSSKMCLFIIKVWDNIDMNYKIN